MFNFERCWVVTITTKKLFGSRHSRMDQVKIVEDSFKKFEVIWCA